LLEAASEKPTNPARVVIIGSVDGLRVPSLETFAYSSSKAGVHHLGRVLADHLGRRGITVNTLACGPFESKSKLTQSFTKLYNLIPHACIFSFLFRHRV